MNTTANKTLEVAFWQEKTYILLVHGIKIIMSLWLISRHFLGRHIPVPHLYWSERRYLLLDPLNRGTRPQPAETAELPGLAAEHWWIAEACTVPGVWVPRFMGCGCFNGSPFKDAKSYNAVKHCFNLENTRKFKPCLRPLFLRILRWDEARVLARLLPSICSVQSRAATTNR